MAASLLLSTVLIFTVLISGVLVLLLPNRVSFQQQNIALELTSR